MPFRGTRAHHHSTIQMPSMHSSLHHPSLARHLPLLDLFGRQLPALPSCVLGPQVRINPALARAAAVHRRRRRARLLDGLAVGQQRGALGQPGQLSARDVGERMHPGLGRL